MKNTILVLLAGLLLSLNAFAEDVVIVGQIIKIVSEKTEIYVSSGGKKYEYYLGEKTAIKRGESADSFDSFKKGMKVKVTATKKGKRLDPQIVEILE